MSAPPSSAPARKGKACPFLLTNENDYFCLRNEGLEAPLPNVTVAPVDFAIAANMSGQEPMHPPAQVAVAFRPESQVKMVGPQTIGQDSHLDASTGLADDEKA